MDKKYAIVIPDGCADEPQDALGGRTPLQAADTPNMDRLASEGRVGLTVNVPDDLPAGSDVANLSLLGYDPHRYYTGRAPLEAAALGVEMDADDWAFRCNLVSVRDGLMIDFSGGHISSEEGRVLIEMLQLERGGTHIRFVPGVSYRNLMLYRPAGEPAPFDPKLVTTPPHDITDQPISGHLPKGPGADLLLELMLGTRNMLETHEVNRVRTDLGENPANMIWLWGEGKAPTMPTFEEVYGVRGAYVTAVDLVRGLGTLFGWDPVDVPTATGYLDTDYAAKGRAAVEALADHDLVCVHVEAPDEAGHEGGLEAKIEALEQIDKHVVGPLADALAAAPWHRMLVSPDHPTPVRVRTHTHGPVPFVLWGTDVERDQAGQYSEAQAERVGLLIQLGHELMEWFLKG